LASLSHSGWKYPGRAGQATSGPKIDGWLKKRLKQIFFMEAGNELSHQILSQFPRSNFGGVWNFYLGWRTGARAVGQAGNEQATGIR
jgi:hypothetical protein